MAEALFQCRPVPQNEDDKDPVYFHPQFTSIKASGKTFMMTTSNNDIYWMGDNMPKLYVFMRQKITGMQRVAKVRQPIADLCFDRKKCFFIGTNGLIYGWGDNTWFELNSTGNETKNKISQLDYKIEETQHSTDNKEALFASASNFVSVRAANDCSFLITQKGVYSIGNRTNGLLGYLPPKEVLVHPRKIEFGAFLPLTQKMVGLSASQNHVFAWSDAGRAFAWGYNYNGVLGVENNRKHQDKLFTTPQIVHAFAFTPVLSLEACDTCSFAINHRGKAFYWGRYLRFT